VSAVDIDFPFHVAGTGRTATAGRDDHVRDLIEQVLFTTPGERVNRPEFGCGLLDHVFEPNSPDLAAALLVTLQAALHRWLGDVITVESLDAVAEDSQLRILIRYVVLATGQVRADVFDPGGA
jgi:Bacteriophage baseplate protein W